MLLKFAIQDFKDDREFKNMSPVTIDSYMFTFKDFQGFCAKREILNVEEVSASTIKSFLIHCQKDRKNNPVTINTKIKNLRALFNYLVQGEVINERFNPMNKIDKIKTDVKIEVFSDDQIQQMLAYYRRLKTRDKSFYAYRDYTMILSLLGTGMRVGELCNLAWHEIDLINGTMIVFGKNRQQASIPLTDKIVKELSEYRIFCDNHFSQLSDYVFVDKKNKPLTSNAVKCIFKRLKTIMNFKNVRLSAHTFRHTFAHRCLIAGMDVFTLQKMLRHSNLRMTEKYLALWGTALKEQNDKFNPLNNIDF
ncbi:tyrosine-type recombinase/integrase [Salipaludibacillus sp. CF4.18]|uniref:tyrosine-type recombinase/integrase n=1 Tax=Salipaludibacillus sp. CF4.18 TaxID=3373081 RepID=UPI003EE717B5